MPSTAIGAPGDLDEDFSGDGFAEVTHPERPGAVAITPSGSLLVVGAQGSGPERSVAIARYGAGGELDVGYGAGGQAALYLGAGSAVPRIVTMVDGSHLVAGLHSSSPGSEQVALVRLEPEGSIDPTFGSNGVLTVAVGGYPHDLDIDRFGRIVLLAGPDLLRLQPDGTPDPGFSDDGRLAISGLAPRAAVPAEDGSIFVGGVDALTRVTSTGEIDQGFGGAGRLQLPGTGFGGPSSRRVAGLEVDRDGGVNIATEDCPQPFGGGGSGEVLSCTPFVHRASAAGEALSQRRDLSQLAFLFEADPGGIATSSGQLAPSDRHPLALAAQRWDPATGDAISDFGVGAIAYAYHGFHGPTPVDSVATQAGGVVSLVSVTDRSDARTALLMRLEGVGEPRDSDGDGVLDSGDACDLFRSGPDSAACPTIPRTVRLKRTGRGSARRVVAWLYLAPVEACDQHVAVRLYRKRPGRDDFLGKAGTGFRGVAFFRGARPRGRMYAVARSHFEPDLGTCAEARSVTRDFRSPVRPWPVEP